MERRGGVFRQECCQLLPENLRKKARHLAPETAETRLSRARLAPCVADAPLVNDENAQAWPHGPVFPSLYHEFSEFGSGPITHLAGDYEIVDPRTEKVRLVVTPDIPKSDKPVRRLLDRIWGVYGDLSPWQLSDMTHRPDSPWDRTRRQAGGKAKTDIADTTIKAHYKTLMAERRGRDG